MKNLILTLILTAPLLAAAQSVPNGNFESWVDEGAFENPEFWSTDNLETSITVSKDLDSYEGDFAMRVTAQSIGVGEYGEATTVMEIDAIPAALNFYAKVAVEFGSASVIITFHNEEMEVYSETWFSAGSTDGYAFISMPLDQIEPVITHARITVSAQVGDFAPGTAAISVDAMDFGEPMGVQQSDRISIRLYPNPAREVLRIESIGQSLGHLSVFDALGRKVHEVKSNGESANLHVGHLPKGIYLIAGEGSQGVRGKFVVE